jgi:hypothetical protein
MMKNNLSEAYQAVLLSEAEKNSLQNPGSDEISNIKTKQDLFGSVPKPVEGPDKAKLAKGPSYKETTGIKSSGTTSSNKEEKSELIKTKQPEISKHKTMKDTKVTDDEETTDDENEKTPKKKEVKEEGISMSAFEALFKKTIQEELEDEVLDQTSEETELDNEFTEDELEADEEQEEGDLVSDLKDLQTRITDILSKLEDSLSEESETSEDEEYSEEDFDSEFGNDEEDEDDISFKESLEKPKALSNSKAKILMNKKNKLSKLKPKGGKANTGDVKCEPKPKPLGDKKGALQKNKSEVKSNLKKGDFIK